MRRSNIIKKKFYLITYQNNSSSFVIHAIFTTPSSEKHGRNDSFHVSKWNSMLEHSNGSIFLQNAWGILFTKKNSTTYFFFIFYSSCMYLLRAIYASRTVFRKICLKSCYLIEAHPHCCLSYQVWLQSYNGRLLSNLRWSSRLVLSSFTNTIYFIIILRR